VIRTEPSALRRSSGSHMLSSSDLAEAAR